MSTVQSPAAARRTFLTLSFTRWFSVGLVVGIFILWILERGLTISEAATALGIRQGAARARLHRARRTLRNVPEMAPFVMEGIQ